ncbi:adhesion G-protein coupled receptor D1-like [Acropora millepora]|uniref:adhesion G-protein coupled receptor D1-like n=1 Tax=Acropora millepora TaxID=45264 RepID=UPI001CF4E0E9|nr:adhesion G-protein coupled receptor D1-like [Acropora millepora]
MRFSCTWGVLLLSMSVVLENVAIGVKGERCSSTLLDYKELEQGNCEQLLNGTVGEYRTLECPHQDLRTCIDQWCGQFSSCLHQTLEWSSLCSSQFRWFLKKRFDITALEGVQNGSYIRNLRLRYCYTTYSLWWRWWRWWRRPLKYKFSITTTAYHCHSKNQPKEDNDGGNADADNMTDLDLSTEITYDLSTLDLLNNNSLKEAVDILARKIDEYLNSTAVSGQTGNTTITSHEKMQRVLLATIAFEEFVLEFAETHLSESAPVVHFTSEKIDLQVRRASLENETDFHLKDAKNYIQLPSTNFHNGSTILGVMYKDLHRMFATTSSEQDTAGISSKSLNTIITSVTMRAQSDKLRENVVLGFKNVQPSSRNRECVFWNFAANGTTGWSVHGCHISSMDNYGTECSCNHLTHFAVLVQFDASAGGSNSLLTKADESALIIITRVGLVLSLIGIALTIICYVFLADIKAPLSQIRVSLVSALGAGQIIFFAGIGATENKGACVAVAAMVQYFLMAAFCWMLVEGVYLYLFVVKVYNVSDKLKICHGVSWSVPAVMVILTLSVASGKDGVESFVSEQYCWMSTSSGLIWVFVSFFVFIEVLNIAILVRVIKEMTTIEQVKDSHADQIRLGIRACVVLIPLLGITWLFGLLSSTHKAFVYIFTILNSAQGFFIFLLHCLRNTEIRERLKRKFRGILPFVTSRTNGVKKESSRVHESSGVLSLKKIKILPIATTNKSTES